ncbi:hypothetical protein MCOR25_007355 [Pyricularia grisea]|uniref:Uncharacterized protein n=1 Tax=Pyricularia grisea TaxID=148305 RepID=A0A6P8ARL9_PYRGI|nr:uncharacterized protein PgNI_09884 [Pyricularia grisea]KAI6358314.1 hypothetical protein MCOR25_007355 [Pyricularia grisea]TLD04758.1 hypothetical protein PgNI_09884 [Pyricularia grisea]
MRAPTAFVAIGLLASAAVAAPSGSIYARDEAKVERIAAVPALLEIAPDSKSCAPELTGCATAEQVAPLLAEALRDYNFHESPWEMAAIISLTVHESAQFKYRAPANAQHAEEFPLKGTSNMQSADFNFQFAKSLPAIAKDVNDIVKDAANASSLNKDQMKSLLKVLQRDETNFASGSWFLRNKCSEADRNGIKTGTRKGWVDYISNCVGVKENTQDPEWKKREDYWVKTVKAMKLTVKT